MSGFNFIGRLIYRYRWLVVLLWGLVVLGSAFFAPNLSERLKGGGFEGADTESERVRDIIIEDFGASPARLLIVFEGDGSPPAHSEEFQQEQNASLEGVREIEETRFVATYSDSEDERFISEDGDDSYAVVGFEVSENQTQELVDRVRREVKKNAPEGLQTYVTGAPAVYLDIQKASSEDIRRVEAYVFPLALVILVVAFGSIVAAGLPVLVGGASVVTTLSALYFLSGTYDMSVFSLSIATMLGLGLGIDYALFAVSRFREELENYLVAEAVPRTMATAGRSIFFSGTAVLIGLSGLLFFPFMFMRSIGVAGVVVVFVTVAAALTLLPATLGILGHRVNALAIRRRSFDSTRSWFWGRSAELVMRRPVIVLLAVGAVLTALLHPVLHMKVGIPEASVLPERYESRTGDDILKEEFDYASLNPIQMLVATPGDPLGVESLAATQELGERVRSSEGIESINSIYTVGEEGAREYAERVSEAREEVRAEIRGRVDAAVEQRLANLEWQLGWVPPGAEERVRQRVEARAAEEIESQVPELPEGISTSGEVTPEGVANFLDTPEARESGEIQQAIDSYVGGDRTMLRAVTESDPYSEQARATIEDIRSIEPPEGTSFLVGGLSAGQRDFIGSLYDKALYAVAFVLGVTYLLLFFTFRSFFIPLKAVAVNILSLTASFGVMVLVFQDGNLSGLLNFTPLGFVDATLPILMFCTIFGVSMDYEVFLLSRMKEAYENGDSNTASVAKGLVSTAGIITSAAAIIISVTGAFAFTEVIITKAIGLGLAVAVFVDATIIRILLVPATMRILGDWNWWPGGRKSTFTPSRQWPSRRSGIGAEEERMNGQSSQNEIEQAEATYRSHVETRRRLGTMLAEAIRRDGGLSEFRRRMEDLPFLIRSADVRRTELKVELLGRRLKEAQKEHRRATEEARRAGVALEETRRAYARAVNVEQRSRLEAQRLEELHREELGHLERLRSETAERQEEKEGDGTPRAAEDERARRAQDPVHVLPREAGWAVVREGNERATSVHPTQAEAAKAGREIARKARSAFLLHAKDGRVRDRSDYGEDPVLRPKGEPPKRKLENPADEATLGRDAAADGQASGIVGGAIEGLGQRRKVSPWVAKLPLKEATKQTTERRTSHETEFERARRARDRARKGRGVARLTRVTPRDPFWAPPPAALALAGDEVHVWRVDVRSAYARRNDLWRVLAKDERQKATDLLFEGDRRRFVVSRGVLRVLLGRYLRAQPDRLVFGYNPHGKPFLVGAPGVRFSTSHSHDLVLLAFVRDRDIGVDVEHLREVLGLDEIASRHFATREVATLRSLPNSSRKEAFFACWTRKEAFAKAKGRGLTLPFNRFEVTLTPGEPAMLQNVEEDIREPFRWAMQELIPGPCYAAALVVEEHTVRSSCWQYTG